MKTYVPFYPYNINLYRLQYESDWSWLRQWPDDAPLVAWSLEYIHPTTVSQLLHHIQSVRPNNPLCCLLHPQQSHVSNPPQMPKSVELTYINTKANITAARDNLSSLNEYMESLPDSNIETFNEYVKEQLETLEAGGETTTELITNLFKGYLRAKDDTFREWVRIKKLENNDGTYNINPNGTDFMNAARKH